MIRFSFLRTLTLFRLVSYSKKIKFLCELGIFIVLVALVSSFISISFESKLMKLNNELIKVELEESKIQDWLSISTEKNLRLKLRKFYFRMLQHSNESKKFSNPTYKKAADFYILTRQKNEIGYAIEAMESIMSKIKDNKDFAKKYNISKMKEQKNEITDFVWHVIGLKEKNKTFAESKKFIEIDQKIMTDYLNMSEYIFFQTNLFFHKYNDFVDEKKDKLKKKILVTTKKSTDAILYAFFMQLFIFIIIQFLELREVSREKKNTK